MLRHDPSVQYAVSSRRRELEDAQTQETRAYVRTRNPPLQG